MGRLMVPVRPNKPKPLEGAYDFWSLIEGLKLKGLLSRAARIEYGGVVLELREETDAPPPAPKELTPEQQAEEDERILFAASSRD
jgi:hypothetical protein